MINVLSGVIVMQVCDECGAEIPNEAQFCGSCGSKIKIEDDITRSTDFAPVEDKSLQLSENSTTLQDSQELTPDIEKEEQIHGTTVTAENSGEDEEYVSHLAPGSEGEETSFDPVSETSQEQQKQYPTTEDEYEEPGHHEQNEPTSSIPVGASSEPEVPTNQLSADQSSVTQSPNSLRETQVPDASAQKPRSQRASRCLLSSLVGLLAVIVVAAVLVGLFHQNLPVFGGSSNVLSGSSNNENIDPNGSSLTASVCINDSTPSPNGTNQGSNFTLSSSTGCSNIGASKAGSTCLIFASDGSNSHKYIVDVSNAAIVNSPYHLVLSVVDYTAPALYSDVKQVSIGLSEGSTGRNFAWFYRSGSVTVNHDERSGSMDVILVPEKGANTLHVVGVWACGHQIKSS
jgi:hypothetical protein